MTISRRRFLQAGLGAGVAASLAGSFSWPHIWSRKKAFAAPAGTAGSFGGAILIVLNGGARTQAAFNGTVGLGTNPFGQLSSLAVPLSSVHAGNGLDSAAVNPRLNLISTCQHHNRTGNHGTGRTVACTGYTPEENKPGLLTILNYVFSFRAVPCVNIGNDTPTTDIGSEISSTFAPIKIASPLSIQDILASIAVAQVSPEETTRLDELRAPLQDRYLRSTKYKQPADIPYFQRRAAEIAAQFEDAALDIRSASSLGRYLDGTNVTNAGLRTSFGVSTSGGGNSMGAKAMLALRLRQLGCAGITLSSDENWDLHSNEDQGLPPRANDCGRAIAGLVDHMSRIPDPFDEGKTLLDTTVITVMTDFNRGNWSAGGGFNGGQGSDHSTDEDKTALQCIPIVGGGLPGGRVLGEVSGTGSAVGSSPVYETRQVIATVLDVLGIPPGNYLPGSVAPLTQELLS